MPATLDALISTVDAGLRTVTGAVHASKPIPRAEGAALDDTQRRLSGALMRVNHVGEVCAQALYQAQALTTRSPELRSQMEEAAREETDHLAWTLQRLDELGCRRRTMPPVRSCGR
jgi:ubiquinone biosynthesis monooxygenase Coq7